jgi:glutamate/tyrosine decarboxylase-like PLP-dependent enzyme
MEGGQVEHILDALVQHIRVWLADADSEFTTSSPTPEEIRRRSRLTPPLEGEGIDGVLEGMDDFLRHSVKTHHAGFMNSLWGGFNASAFAGEVLTALAQTSMYTFETAPFASMVEQAIIKRMSELVGFADGNGVLTTGGSNGNLLGLLCARQNFDPLSIQRGFDGRNKVVMVSEESHYSVLMAANVMGLGSSNVIKVRCDANGCLRTDSLQDEIEIAKRSNLEVICIIATSGTTVRGAFDPLREIATIAHSNDIWLHVDAAWGGSCLFSAKHANLMDGVELADSVCWDAHKMMGAPLICSAFLIKNTNILRAVCSHTSDVPYLFHNNVEDFDLGRISLQCGRRNDALKLWLAWREIGDAGWARRCEEFIELADYFQSLIEQQPEMEMMSTRKWTNVCFRMKSVNIDPNVLNDKIRDEIMKRGKWMTSKAVIDGQVILRPVIANSSVSKKSLQGFIEECLTCLKTVQDGEMLIQ